MEEVSEVNRRLRKRFARGRGEEAKSWDRGRQTADESLWRQRPGRLAFRARGYALGLSAWPRYPIHGGPPILKANAGSTRRRTTERQNALFGTG